MGDNVIDVQFNKQEECLPLVFKSVGPTGPQGVAGKSAYQQAVEGGYTGTEVQFNEELGSFGDFAQSAQTAASTATTQATNAADSAELAQKWATQTTAEVVSGQGYGAKYYADQAADSASSANASASTATTKATEASASASQASQSAIDAANSAASARGLQIGTVYFSQSNLTTDNPGGLPLWTGEYFINGSSLYPDFYAWVKSHAELCKSKTEYDTAISTYGECPYYVVDEVAGSLRLPKLANYIKMADSESGLTQSKAGLPNITGSISFDVWSNASSGCFYDNGGNKRSGTSDDGRSKGSNKTFDASRSSSVYGKSSTVTPAHTTLYPWVYAFNSAVSASEAQAAEFTGALSGKANTDLSNISSNIDYVVESKAATDTDPSWYRIYKSGWIEQGGFVSWNEEFIRKTFLKPFANPPYYASLVPGKRDETFKQWGMTLFVDNITPTTMSLVARNGNNQLVGSSGYWYACGQGAE